MPRGAVDETLTVRVLVAPDEDGVTEAGPSEAHEMPDGRGPTQDKATDCEVPEVSFAVIVILTELPTVMPTGPLFDRE